MKPAWKFLESVPCPWQGVGTTWSLKSLPTQTTLWFYDCMKYTEFYKWLLWFCNTLLGQFFPQDWNLNEKNTKKVSRFCLSLFNEAPLAQKDCIYRTKIFQYFNWYFCNEVKEIIERNQKKIRNPWKQHLGLNLSKTHTVTCVSNTLT